VIPLKGKDQFETSLTWKISQLVSNSNLMDKKVYPVDDLIEQKITTIQISIIWNI